MIYQISSVPAKTSALVHLNKGLIQARHIQARLKESAQHSYAGSRPASVSGSSLFTANCWFD